MTMKRKRTNELPVRLRDAFEPHLQQSDSIGSFVHRFRRALTRLRGTDRLRYSRRASAVQRSFCR